MYVDLTDVDHVSYSVDKYTSYVNKDIVDLAIQYMLNWYTKYVY